jgi:Uma2 family endonuclease
MRTAPVKTQTSFEDFLKFEAQSPDKHEFVDGNLFVMAGGTRKHNELAGELYLALKAPARAAGYRTYFADVLIRTPNNVGYYPDLQVVATDSRDSQKVVHSPIIIIEVLSESTEMFDRGEKWQNYQTIESLEQYVLLSQTQAQAEVYSRAENNTWRYQLLPQEAMLEFPSLGFSLRLEQLYQDLPN